MQTTALLKSVPPLPPHPSTPGGLDDDMWMKCLYGLCTEAVNHHSPAAFRKDDSLSGTRRVFRGKKGEWGGGGEAGRLGVNSVTPTAVDLAGLTPGVSLNKTANGDTLG